MCGICGYAGPGNPAVLDAMSRVLGHRGPDGEGRFVAEGVGLAHRRLAVIDRAGGRQPMGAPEGEILVFNGEIYNFRELRSELERLGHRFDSRSDTEVLLRSYRQWGEGCLPRLRGMFAFALWDPARQRLFAARDRVGIKPFYYTEKDGVLWFASEAKALLEIPGFPRRIDRRALSLYLTFRYTPGEETLFEGIRKLLPGHALSAESGRPPEIRRWWSLEFAPDDTPAEPEWTERFRETFSEAVRLHMESDVPLGAYLSGGLDSSLLVASMCAFSDRPVEAFSVGFRERRFDELPYAREVAERFGCRHHVLAPEEDAAAVLDRVVRHLDEPLGDLAAVPTFLMAEATKPLATVVLSGEGADELLAGYPKYRAFLFGRALSPLLPGGIWRAAGRLARNLSLQRGLASVGASDRAEAYLRLASVFSCEEQDDLLRPEVRRGGRTPQEIREVVAPHFRGGLDGLSQLLSLDFHTWLPDDLLLKNDRMTMAHGVEARVPYLDHELVELCARIPSRFKVRGNREKVLLRKVMAGELPETIRRRRKAGFTVPLGSWMKNPFGARVREILSEDSIREQGLFRPEQIRALEEKPLDHPYIRRQVWTVAALGLWQKTFDVSI